MSLALFYAGSGRYEWRDVEPPAIQLPTDALVRPVAVTSCDLDGAIALGVLDDLGVDYPVGHEFVADVVQVGGDVTHVDVGDRVIVSFQVSCGDCRSCHRSMSGFCNSTPPAPTFGLPDAAHQFGGALADLVRVPYADHVTVPLPADLGPAAAAVSDNFCDGWRTIVPYLKRCSGPVMIDGFGSVAMYATAVAVAEGRAVHYVDPNPGRRARAAEFGAETFPTVDDLPQPRYELVVNTSPLEPTLAQAALRVERIGTLVTTGMHIRPTTPVPVFDLYMRGVSIVNEMLSAVSTIPKALAWLADHPLALDRFIDVRADWASADKTFGRGGKVLITRPEAWPS